MTVENAHTDGDSSNTESPDSDSDGDSPLPPPPPPKPDCLVNPVSCRGADGEWTHWADPETGKVEPISTAKNYDAKFRIEDDHIFPKKAIIDLDDFETLSTAQQNELLNRVDSLQPSSD